MILSHPTTKKLVEPGTVVTIYGVKGHYEPSGIKGEKKYKDCLVLSNTKEEDNVIGLGVKHFDTNGTLRKSWRINVVDFQQDEITRNKLMEIYKLMETLEKGTDDACADNS